MMNELLREQREAMQELTVPGITALLDTEKTDL